MLRALRGIKAVSKKKICKYMDSWGKNEPGMPEFSILVTDKCGLVTGKECL